MGVPFAFSMGGLVGGVVGMFVVSLVSNYCVYLLLVAKAKIGPRFCAHPSTPINAHSES